MLDINDAQRKEAERRLVELASLSPDRANILVTAALNSAVDETLYTMAGNGPVPSQVIALKAHQLRFMCLRAGRILGQREVEVLFRSTSAEAKAILTRTRATYEDALLSEFRENVRTLARVKKTGKKSTRLTWTITIDDEATFEMALAELERLDLRGDADIKRDEMAIVLPREIERYGRKIDPLDELKIARPK